MNHIAPNRRFAPAQRGRHTSHPKLAGLARSGLLLLALGLSACAFPDKPVRPDVYDFGPGALGVRAPGAASMPTIALGEVEAGVALDSTAVLYRLAFADAQQLRPYAQARWSMPPAQLLRQRLREHLGQSRAVVNPGDGGVDAAAPWQLRLELEEFSQLFQSPTSSVGLVRLRVSVVQSTVRGERLLAQRSVVVQQPAGSADAAGGIKALAQASDMAVAQIDQWLQQLPPAR